MESRVAIWALGAGLLLFTSVGAQNNDSRNCSFPAIFNFGDSNSDTGTAAAAFGELEFPFGMSFRNMSKRGSDGRLIIDYIAESLGLPYLESPLDSFAMSYEQGANFAAGGARINSSVHQGLTIPIHLDVQVSQFLQFKSRTIAHSKPSNTTTNNNGKEAPMEKPLPDPEVFSKALYTIDIGQNDVAFGSVIPATITQFSNSLERLLREGAKFIWIHNTGPYGCLPLARCEPNRSGCVSDENGCAKVGMERAQDFNRRLKDVVQELRVRYPQATFTYVDVYSAKLSLITHPNNYGFDDPTKFCCGYGTGAACAAKSLNGTVLGTACKDPAKFSSWDGVHYSQAANKIVAQLVVNGSLSDSHSPIAEACQSPTQIN